MMKIFMLFCFVAINAAFNMHLCMKDCVASLCSESINAFSSIEQKQLIETVGKWIVECKEFFNSIQDQNISYNQGINIASSQLSYALQETIISQQYQWYIVNFLQICLRNWTYSMFNPIYCTYNADEEYY